MLFLLFFPEFSGFFPFFLSEILFSIRRFRYEMNENGNFLVILMAQFPC